LYLPFSPNLGIYRGASAKDEPYFKELGFGRFFKKPINYTELINLILEALPERVNSSQI
jgi:hypothetical protein